MSRFFGLAVVLAAYVSTASADEMAGTTLVNRRILEGEKGWTTAARDLKDYELHDFAQHLPTRRALSAAGEAKITYELNVLGRRMMLELERHDELFAKDYQHMYVDEHGNVASKESAPNCLYKGSIAGEKSAAIISLCHDVVHATVRHVDNPEKDFTIQPVDAASRSSMHIAYHHRDLADSERFCGVGLQEAAIHDVYPAKQESPSVVAFPGRNGERLRRLDVTQATDLEALVQQQRKLDSSTKYIGVSLVNDKKRYDDKGQTVHGHSATLFAIAAGLYSKIGKEAALPSTFSYQLQIVSMYTFVSADPWVYTTSSTAVNNQVRIDSNGEVNANDLLTALETWRVSHILPTQGVSAVNGHDLAHLLTGFTFATNTIGLAYVSGVCSPTSRSGETQATDLSDAHIASTIAHEIGHNLGSQHTDTPPSGFSTCVNYDPELIMSASSSKAYTNWDPCTIEYFTRRFTPSRGLYPGSGFSKCAEAPGTLWNSAPVCGDGLVQGDEDCDCINNVCTGVDKCCDGATCTFKPSAQCSELDGCCTGECQIVTDTAVVCREAVNSCDIPETCSGITGQCGFDAAKATGTVCSIDSLGVSGTCFNNKCLDAKEECIKYGLLLPAGQQWDNTCGNENTDNDCQIACSRNNGPCQTIADYDAYYADGTQCATGKGCFNGTCIAFASIPNPVNQQCQNGIKDQDETDVDCGGTKCIGCIIDKVCLANTDCIPPAVCVVHGQSKVCAMPTDSPTSASPSASPIIAPSSAPSTPTNHPSASPRSPSPSSAMKGPTAGGIPALLYVACIAYAMIGGGL